MSSPPIVIDVQSRADLAALRAATAETSAFRQPDRLPLRAQLCAATVTLADNDRVPNNRERSGRVARALLQYVTREIQQRSAAAETALLAAGVADVEARRWFVDAHVAMGAPRAAITAVLERFTSAQ